MKLNPADWSLRAKLAASFLVLVLLALAQAAFAYRTVVLDRVATDWVGHTYQVIALAHEAHTDVDAVRSEYRNYLLAGDEHYLQAYTVDKGVLAGHLSQLVSETADNAPQLQRWKSIEADVNRWQAEVAEPDIQRERSNGGSAASGASIAANSLTRSQAQFAAIDDAFSQAAGVEKRLLARRVSEAAGANEQLVLVLIAGTAALVVAALGLAALLSTSIGGAIGRLARAADRLASGELDERIENTHGDEIGLTARAFNLMAERLLSLVANLREQVGQREQAESALQEANSKLTNWVNELEQRDREASLLAETGELLQACVTLDEAYQVIASVLPRLFPDQPVAVCVINESRNLVDVVAMSGQTPRTQQTFEPDECWALRLGRPHRCVGAGGGLACSHIVGPRPAISVCLPMVAQGASLGMLHLALTGAHEGERSFRATEQMATTLADQIGLALANLRLRETLRTQALRDPLTGLFNRRYLEESLDREISRAVRRGSPLSVLMMDIDRFKRLNDTYGHQTGDDVLRQVARIMMHEIRAGDLACRYGGEEFTLILPEASAENAFRRAEHIRQAIADLPISEERQTYGPVTVSFGVAGFPDHGASADELVHAADAALYRAKRAGRNRVEMAEIKAPSAVAAGEG